MLRIRGWEVFEKADSRKVKTLSWVALPVELESLGFAKLMAGPGGLEAYGLWAVLLAIAARSPCRGEIAYTLDEIALKARTSPDAVRRGVARLLEVGWLLSDEEALEQPVAASEPEALPVTPEPEKAPSRAVKATHAERLGDRVAAIWNEMAGVTGLPACRVVDGAPRLPGTLASKLNARRRDCEDDEDFIRELADRLRRLARSPFHLGQNGRGWRATLGWVLEPGGWEKCRGISLEGPRPAVNGKATGLSRLAANRRPDAGPREVNDERDPDRGGGGAGPADGWLPALQPAPRR